MSIHLSLAGESPLDFESLYEWLRQEEALRGKVQKAPKSLNQHEMGALSDVLIVAVGAGGMLSVVANSLSTWLQNRGTNIRICITSPQSEKTVTIEAGNVKDTEALLRMAMGETSEDG